MILTLDFMVSGEFPVTKEETWGELFIIALINLQMMIPFM